MATDHSAATILLPILFLFSRIVLFISETLFLSSRRAVFGLRILDCLVCKRARNLFDFVVFFMLYEIPMQLRCGDRV